VGTPLLYRVLADAILVMHLLFVAFVVLGFGLILVGIRAKWNWVHNRLFRVTHLVAIIFVVVQAWFGAICPLTVWENQLRQMAGESGYSQTFIGYWLHKILFYQAEPGLADIGLPVDVQGANFVHCIKHNSGSSVVSSSE